MQDPLIRGKYVKMTWRGHNIKLKKFQCMELRDFYELMPKVIEYAKSLRDESHRWKTFIGNYY